MEYEAPVKETQQKKDSGYEKEEYNSVYYMIPKDKDSIESFITIDRQTKVAARERFGIRTNADWECYTIAAVYLSSLAVFVMNESKKRNGEKITRCFYDMLIIQSSYRKNIKAEKTGSFNMVVTPGEALSKIRDNPDGFWQYDKTDPESVFMPKDGFTEDTGFSVDSCRHIDKLTRMIAYQKHSIMIPDHYLGLVTAVAYTFFEMVFKHLILKTKQSESEPKFERLLMGEHLDINCYETEDGVMEITLIPGPSLKLIAKGDNVSENIEID